MALIKCSECGSDISEKASVCPKCGCPVDISKEIIIKHKKEKIKKVVISVIAFIVVTIIAVVAIKIIKCPTIDGYYSDTKWGMTTEQVKNILGDNAEINENKDSVLITYQDYEGKDGIHATVVCTCTDNSLNEVSIFLTIKEDSSYTDSKLKLAEEYMEKFSELYGEAEENSIITFWNAPKSKIELIHLTSGMVIITYKDITRIEE